MREANVTWRDPEVKGACCQRLLATLASQIYGVAILSEIDLKRTQVTSPNK